MHMVCVWACTDGEFGVCSDLLLCSRALGSGRGEVSDLARLLPATGWLLTPDLSALLYWDDPFCVSEQELIAARHVVDR